MVGLGQLKNAVTSTGIESVTFQPVTWCLKQLHYRIPIHYFVYGKQGVRYVKTYCSLCNNLGQNICGALRYVDNIDPSNMMNHCGDGDSTCLRLVRLLLNTNAAHGARNFNSFTSSESMKTRQAVQSLALCLGSKGASVLLLTLLSEPCAVTVRAVLPTFRKYM
jgi:hypothetical protein